MERVLFLAHTQEGGTLPKAALEVLTAVRQVSEAVSDGSFSVGLVGGSVQAAAGALAGSGANAFYGVEGPEFDVSRYASDATAAEALVRKTGATVVVVPATSRFSRAIPGVVQRVEGRIDTHVTAVNVEDGRPSIERWYYRQRMVATLARAQRPWFLLIDAGVFAAWSGAGGAAKVEAVAAELPDLRTRVEGEQAASAEAQTIRPDADLLFVAGAGWTKKQQDGQTHLKDAESLIWDFLQKSRASLGSSKSLVDQSAEGEDVISFMSHVNQVGQTGSTPRHLKGLATCCHGEEPHVVGWRFIKERRAVNLDAGCGWAQGKADVLYVADAFKVMAKVNEVLGNS
ncbi:MAG: electron transfer flavoprotein subunit alpha [Gemmatimonadota bacterium]|nr:MAG: electron transfer flavoprotein subunit alpha [Gemmatimonadota bacterium]